MKIMTYKNIARCPACLTELIVSKKKQSLFGPVVEARCPYCGLVSVFSLSLNDGPNARKENSAKSNNRG